MYKLVSRVMDLNFADPDAEEEPTGVVVKRAQCTMSVLQAWYKVQKYL